MNKIDFSHPGGFPLTQDELDFMQQSYISAIQAVGAAGVNGAAPTVLTGMAVSTSFIGVITVTSGWFIYGGELIQFPGGSIGIPGGLGYVALISIIDSTTNLTYNDTTTFPAHHSKTGTLIAGLPVTDASHFPLSALVPWGIITPFSTSGIIYPSTGFLTVVSVGSPYFPFSYKIEGNIITLAGAINVSNGVGGGPIPVITLPTHITPTNTIVLTNVINNVTSSSGLITLDTSGAIWINTTGSGIGNMYFDSVSYRLN